MRTVDFPGEWATARVVDHVAHIIGPDVNQLGVFLDDGTILFALIYPGGHRFVRCSGDTGWSIEERFGGLPPKPADADRVNTQWAFLLELLIQTGRDADNLLIGLGLEPGRRRA